MSLNIFHKTGDGTGVLQKIAGHTVLLDTNVSEVRHGTWSIPARVDSANYSESTVTFSDPMPDTDYALIINGTNYAYSRADSQRTDWMITNKTVNGFTIGVYMAIDSQDLSTCTGEYWAIKPIKLDGYTELQNKVNNPDSEPTENSLNLVTSGGVYDAILESGTTFVGTREEWDELSSAEQEKYKVVCFTGEGASGSEITDTIENGNMSAVTSNAVYNQCKIYSVALPGNAADTPIAESTPNVSHEIVRLTVPKGTYVISLEARFNDCTGTPAHNFWPVIDGWQYRAPLAVYPGAAGSIQFRDIDPKINIVRRYTSEHIITYHEFWEGSGNVPAHGYFASSLKAIRVGE